MKPPQRDSKPTTQSEIESLERRIARLESTLRGLAHDLRSPLVSVLGFARLLRDERPQALGRTGLHFVDRIEQAGRHMQRLLDDLLELARIAHAPHHAVHVQPARLLEQLVGEFKIRLDDADMELVWNEDLPIVVFDRTRLYQILANLVGNAIRHMDRASGGRIEIDIVEVDGGWELSVADNGRGIAAKDRERIFDAFETTRGAPSPGRSSGLGLAIVREIVESSGGRIFVESEVGRGARFVVRLPRR